MKSEDKATIGKANKSAANLLDATLHHVLTNVSNLKLDGKYSNYREMLVSNNIYDWEDFEMYSIDQLAELTYTDKQGNKVDFRIHKIGWL